MKNKDMFLLPLLLLPFLHYFVTQLVHLRNYLSRITMDGYFWIDTEVHLLVVCLFFSELFVQDNKKVKNNGLSTQRN